MSKKDTQQQPYAPYPPYGYPPHAYAPPPPPQGYPPHTAPPSYPPHPHAYPHAYAQPAPHQAPPAGHHHDPYGQHGHAHPHHHAPHAGHPGHGHGHHHPDPMEQQAQAMLEGMMGDQAGLFKDLMNKLGVDDKEFWKGAMIGAAAALILSNDNVRGSLMQLVTGAGDMLKTGGGKIKEGTCQAASAVSNTASMGSEVFRDTVRAGTEGFKDSVERHRTPGDELGAAGDDSQPENDPAHD